MPSGTPAYKDNSPIVSATDRCNMVKLAIKPFDYMSLSTIETDRPGNTYTADTLAQIYDSYKKIYFIIGADSLLYIQDWYHPEYICSHCHLLCANRDNNSASVLIDQKHFLADKYGEMCIRDSLGEYSSEPLGDYFAGPNHVLPTNGTAKFFSPLSVDDFIKKSSIISYSRNALEAIHTDIEKFATAEHLTAHALSLIHISN